MLGWLILLVLVFFLGRSSTQQTKKGKSVSLWQKPWLISPWNQSTYALGYRARRGFEIDPHPWDVANDPEYYKAVAKMRYHGVV